MEQLSTEEMTDKIKKRVVERTKVQMRSLIIAECRNVVGEKPPGRLVDELQYQVMMELAGEWCDESKARSKKEK